MALNYLWITLEEELKNQWVRERDAYLQAIIAAGNKEQGVIRAYF